MANFVPHRIDTTLTDPKKLSQVNDYVSDPYYRCANFGTNPSIWGASWANGRNINYFHIYGIFLRELIYRLTHRHRRWSLMAQTTLIHARMRRSFLGLPYNRKQYSGLLIHWLRMMDQLHMRVY